MKKNSIKNIFKLIPAFLALISGVFLFSSKSVSAETLTSLPDYFSVYTANYADGTYTKKTEAGTFVNGNAFFVKDNEAVVLEFDEDKLKLPNSDNLRISQEISYVINYNDNVISTSLDTQSGFDISNDKIFSLKINPGLVQSSNFEYYGKYSITFSYQYLNDAYDPEYKTFTCNFYVFNHSAYFSSKIFSPKQTNDKSPYYYNYSSQNQLFNLEYDYTKFNVTVTKVYQQISNITVLKNVNGEVTITNYDELSAVTNKSCVKFDYLYNTETVNGKPVTTKTDHARITFNDLGTYYITYETIFGNGEVFNSYYLPATDIETLLNDTVNIFGVQSFYTGQNGLEEFKQIDFSNSSTVLQQADVTGIVGTSIANITTDNISAIKKQNIVSTNQAPVYFTTNASISSSDSCYWIFDSVDDFTEDNVKNYKNATPKTNYFENYTNTPLSKAGVYLVKLAYNYNTTSATAKTYYQWFCFEITTSSPQIEIKEIVSEQDKNEDGKIDDDEREYSPIPTDYVTYNNVFVTKKESGVFDSPATLKVYKALSFNSSDLELDSLSETVNSSKIFEESAKYKVELTYGNKGQKKYVSYFTIDKTGITDITINTTTKITNTTYRKDDQTLDSLFTNQAVAISWNNKEAVGKAQTYAEYKYFPTQFSLTLSNSLSSEEIRSIYNSPYTKNGIVSNDLFTYTGGTLPVSTYANTIGLNSLSEGRVLSDSGLYIIRIYDQTANVKEVVGENVIYKVIFIDKTKTNIISVDDNIWSYTSNAKTTTKDYTLYFGEYKLVKLISDSNANVDPWLNDYVLNDEEIKNNYFINYKGDTYFKINNLKYVWYNQNTNGINRQIKYFLSETNNYGMTINAIDNAGNPNESQYIFYIGSTSNSKINDSFDSFKSNYNVNHMVTFTTDNSKMTLSYKNQDGNVWNLQQVAVETVDTTAKYNFYQPTAKNTLSNSNEVLDFSYVTEPSTLLSVNSIKLEYYAFEKGTNGTYIFKNTPSATFDIYNKTGIQLGSIVAGEVNTFTWKLNVETIQGQTRTKAGKYVITREYVSSSDANDPKTRVITFIVDRNGIISEPEVDQSGNSVYYTGGSIKLQVLNNYQSINSTTLFFNDIYYANQMSQNSGTHTPVLVTNLLPVTIYVPAYKYGYDDVSSNNIYKFKEEPSIIEYGSDTKNQNKFDGYKLTAIVEYRKSNNLSTKVDKTTILNNTSSNNYLTSLDKGKGLDTFKDEGYYRVIIESNAGDTFTFDFQIKYESPDYSLLDENNNPLAEKSGIYYTNKSKIRIAWEDSESAYLANINQDEIKYTIEGYAGEVKINPNLVQGSGNSHYVDLDLTNYVDLNGKKVNITLQFKGNEGDYDKSYFSKTTTVVIDTDAPITNLKELIKQTGLSFGDLRDYVSGNKYNISKNTGLFANYSFVIDKDNFKNFLKTPEQTGYDFYKVYYTIFEKDGLNTKYVLGNSQESDITLENYSDILANVLYFNNSVSNFNKLFDDNAGKYIEIVEEDYAGNRTVYTVFVTDLKGNESAIKYKALTSSSKDNEIEIKYSDLQKNQDTNFETSIDIRSKHSLNLEEVNLLNAKAYLSNKYYQLISVNGEMFVKTPFSDEYFYKQSEFTSTENSPRYTLKDLTSLKSNSFAQKIIIYSAPIFGKITLNAYVLNKALEYSTLSSFENDESKEGIVVKLPSESSDTNIIYCEELTIKCVIGGNQSIIVLNNETLPYFKEEQAVYKSNSYEISYVSGLNNSKYFKLEITRNINKNDYFVYTLTDNFGDVSKIYHIFGQIDIKEPITSEEDIVSSYDEQGTYIHYSSSDITYKYDSTIYSGDTTVTVTNQGITYSYTITKNGSTITVGKINTTEEYERFFEYELISGSIMALKLKASKIDFASGELGKNLKFSVKLTLNDDFKTDGENENTEKTFVTYNKVPKITLLGANDDDVTNILGNKGIYTNKIKINIENTVLDFPYEVYLITPSNLSILLTEEYTAEENGTYYLVINYLGDIKGVSKKLAFTIKNSSDFKFSVLKINSDGSYSEIERTGNPYSYNKQNGTIIEQNHYITNANYTILLNESLNLVCDRVETVDEYTAIYVIHTDYSIQTATEYYSCRIAVTKIPETNSIFNEKGFIKYETDGSSVDLVKLSSDVSSVFTKTGFEQGKKLAWSKYYLIPENKINVTVYYNEIDKALFTPEIVENDNLYTTTLKSSGIYFFKFSDLAGNVHFFGTYKEQEYFSMQYLSSVIFEVNEESPINYAIYDREVKVSVPLHTLNLYDSNARPVINVEFNGKPLDVKTTNSYSWTFTKEGLYKIWFTAKIGGETIYEAPTYFTILSSEESRLSFSFISYENCYIEDILRNGTSIYSKLANANSGNLYNNKYLKDVIIHINDIKTGEGVYTFVVNANNEFGQKYTFTIWINNPNVPIIISHESGTTTDKNITITFTSSNVLNEVGDCILKITGQEDIYITKELLESGTLSELNEIVLSQSREYYIEVTTLSGQLLFSSYINKVEPLNTVSIILITTACVVTVAGVVLFLLLRKKMRIK